MDGNTHTSEPGGRRRRRRRSRRASPDDAPVRGRPGPRPARSLRRAVAGLRARAASPGFATLALFLFLLLNSVDFYVLVSLGDFDFTQTHTGNMGSADDPRRDAAGDVATLVKLSIYGCALLLGLLHARTLGRFLRENPHFVAVLLLVVFGASRSIDPLEVVRSTAQLAFGLVIAIAWAATHAAGRPRALATVVFAPLFALHLGSIALFFAEGLDPGRFVAEGLRFGGLAGHPNSLGGQCVIGVWSALVLATARGASRGIRILAVFGALVFVATASVTGSATTLVATLAVAALTLAMKSLASLDVRFRAPAVLGLLFVALVGGGGLYVASGANEILGAFTESVGKDATFTGRTDLWETGIAAAGEKPWLGWGLDAHETVFVEGGYVSEYLHYHNGFIDTWVAAGGIVVLLLLFEMGRFVTMSGKALLVAPERSLLLPLLAALVILNLTEYSLLRPLSSFYELFLCAWALLWFGLAGAERARAPRRARRRSRSFAELVPTGAPLR